MVWKNGSFAANKGFMMVNQNETSSTYKKAPYSSEYSNSTYRPYVVITLVNFMPNPDGQNKDWWCWAASAKMVGEHNGGAGALNAGAAILTNTDELHSFDEVDFFGQNYNLAFTADAGQRQIVIDAHGSDRSIGGNAYHIMDALQLASASTMTIGIVGNGSLSSANISTMNSELSSGRWVVAAATSDPLGHAIVITDYDSGQQKYTYWDPWNDSVGYFTSTQILRNTIRFPYITVNWSVSYIEYCR